MEDAWDCRGRRMLRQVRKLRGSEQTLLIPEPLQFPSPLHKVIQIRLAILLASMVNWMNDGAADMIDATSFGMHPYGLAYIPCSCVHDW